MAFTAWERAGSVMLRGTEGSAAWWKTTLTPEQAARQVSRSVMSPSRRSKRGSWDEDPAPPASAPYRARKGATFSRRPVEKSSRTLTRAPAARRASTMWEPMNPAPPVTSAFMTYSPSPSNPFASSVTVPHRRARMAEQ